MTAAEVREELEFALWHVPGITRETVEAALKAADKYATLTGSEVLDSVFRTRRVAARREELAEALKAAS